MKPWRIRQRVNRRMLAQIGQSAAIAAVLLAVLTVAIDPVVRLFGWLGGLVVRFWPAVSLLLLAGVLAAASARLRRPPAEAWNRRHEGLRLSLLLHVGLLLAVSVAVLAGT